MAGGIRCLRRESSSAIRYNRSSGGMRSKRGKNGTGFFPRFPIFSHYFPICPRIRVNSYLESPLWDRLGTGFLNCVPFRPIAAFPAVWAGYDIAGAGRHKSGNNAINTAIEGDIWNTCSYDIEGQEAWQEATVVKIFKCDSLASDSYHKVFEGVPPLNSALRAQNNLRNVKNRDIRSNHIETGPVLCFLHVPIKPRVCGYCPQEPHPGLSPRADGGAGIRHTGAFRGRAVSVEGEMFHRLPIVAIAALGIAAFLGIASLFSSSTLSSPGTAHASHSDLPEVSIASITPEIGEEGGRLRVTLQLSRPLTADEKYCYRRGVSDGNNGEVCIQGGILVWDNYDDHLKAENAGDVDNLTAFVFRGGETQQRKIVDIKIDQCITPDREIRVAINWAFDNSDDYGYTIASDSGKESRRTVRVSGDDTTR